MNPINKSEPIILTDLVSIPILDSVDTPNHNRKKSHRTIANVKSYLNLGLLLVGILVYLAIVGITITKIFTNNDGTSDGNLSSALTALKNINTDLISIQAMSSDSKEISVRIMNTTFA